MHANGSLIKHPDMLRAVSTGQVNIAEFLLGQFGNEDPVFAADNLPFVAAGWDNAWKFYQAQKPLLEKKLQARGMRLLYSVAWPGQGIYTKNPLKSVADLKGTKFRTYSPQTARLAELLGASPTVIQVPEVPQAFATGTMQRDDHLVGDRHFDQGLGVREELLRDERIPPQERGRGERARVPAPARGRAEGAYSRPRRTPRSAAGSSASSASRPPTRSSARTA